MKRQPLLIACTVAALAAAGCAGGGSTMTPSSLTNTQSTNSRATVTIKIPPKTSSSSASSRSPQYVSAATNSATFTFTGMAAQVVNLSSGGGNCTTVTGGLSCTAVINAQVGTNETVAIKTFASTDGTGTALTVNTETGVTIVATSNTLTYTLSGVLSAITLAVSPNSVTTTQTASLTATLTPLDPAGDTIIGKPVDANGNPIAGTPTLTASPSTGFTIGAWDDNTGTFPVTYDGSATTSPVTFTASATGVTSGTATVTANVNTIVNGKFALGLNDGVDWYTCYGPRVGTTTSSSPINASPAPVFTGGTPTGSTTPAPTATAATDASVQTTTPSGALPPSGSAQFALVGYSGGTGLPAPGTGKPGKGNTGICQNIASVPANATLTFNVYEGGDDDWAKSDDEADVYPAGAFTTAVGGSPVAAAAPTVRLYAQNNCYDSAGWMAIFLAPPWGTGTVAASTTARWAACPSTPGGASPFGATSSAGGYWYAKSLDLSAYSGQPITLFLGISRDAGANTPTTSGAQYYNYAFYDNVVLTGH